jgi:exodeoxyribonuclease III
VTGARSLGAVSRSQADVAASATDVVGLLTFNVQHAAPVRARLQVDWLTGLPFADVVVLTEVPARSGTHAELLTEHGYTVLQPPPVEDYRVLLAARAGAVREVAFYRGHLSNRFLSAEVSLPSGKAFGVIGLYVPSRGPQVRRNVDKRLFQSDVTAALGRLPARLRRLPVFVAGDFNVVAPDHQPHQPVFSRWEYEFYSSFAGQGFVDAYRSCHPDHVDHSWFGRSGRGYRLDHLFVRAAAMTRVRECRYLHDARRLGLSDHSALAAFFTLPP